MHNIDSLNFQVVILTLLQLITLYFNGCTAQYYATGASDRVEWT